jgi:hypothetical protein
MADGESGYKLGLRRPRAHTRFRKGGSGNPGGRSKKSLRRCSPMRSTIRSIVP